MDLDPENARSPLLPNGGDTPPPISVPDHKLLRLIGQGSYGQVWLARSSLGVYRAVKMVFRSSFRDQKPFEREWSGICKFEPISRSHEGFVDVLHVGRTPNDDCFYYVMELGDDEDNGQKIDPATYKSNTLDKRIFRSGRLKSQESLELVLALSQALAEMHKRGLVHRDIKPSNIIFVNGIPKLADLGLVTDLDATRSFVGTEGYIPPEGAGTPAADVFSLGKVLYEACSGKDRNAFPSLPTLLGDDAEQQKLLELNAVMLRACQNDAEKRYASAWDMYADLLVLADGRSVQRLHQLEQRWEQTKRLAGIGVLGLAFLGGITYPLLRNRQLLRDARQQEAGANAVLGIRAMDAGDLVGAQSFFIAAANFDLGQPVPERLDRIRLASLEARSPRLTRMWFGEGLVETVEVSPDDQTALIVSENSWHLLDLTTGKERAGIPDSKKNERFYQGAFSPDGQYFALGSGRSNVIIRAVADGSQVATLDHSDAVTACRFAPDGRRLFTGCRKGKVCSWDWSANRQLSEITGGDKEIFCIGFSHDGKKMVTTGEDGGVIVWDEHGNPSPPLKKFGEWVEWAAFSRDDKTLAVACSDFNVRFWNLESHASISPALHHDDMLSRVEYSPDGRTILTAALDATVRLWDAETHQVMSSSPILKHDARVGSAVFFSDGRRILSGCEDGSVRLYDLAPTLYFPTPLPRTFSSDGARYARRGTNGFQVCLTASNQPVAPGFEAPANETVQLNRDGQFLVRIRKGPVDTNNPAKRDVEIQGWSVVSNIALGPAMHFTNDCRVVLSPDGTKILVHSNNTAECWNTATAEPLFRLPPPYSSAREAVFSPDGSKVAIARGREVTVRVAADGRELFPPLSHPVTAYCIAFNPAGTRIVTGCQDNSFTPCYAQVWDCVTGRPVGERMQHGDGVLSVNFSPDGSKIVTTGEDFRARVWDAETGKPLTPWFRHQHQIYKALFSPDGSMIATVSRDRTARLWDALTGEPLTPPFIQMNDARDIQFLPNASFVTIDTSNQSSVYPIALEPRPLLDLASISRLNDAGMDVPLHKGQQSSAGSSSNLWTSLSTSSSSDFSVSTSQIAAWEDAQAALCRHDGDWAGAAFHLGRLRDLQPGDPIVAARLLGAQERQRTNSFAH